MGVRFGSKDLRVEVVAVDKSNDICSVNEKGKGTLILRGWHPNHFDFKIKRVKGEVTYIGPNIIIEIGDKNRFQIDLSSLLKELVKEVKPTKKSRK